MNRPRPEQDKWGGFFPDVTVRILRSKEPGYNCFAWAVGSTSAHIDGETVAGVGLKPDVDGWSTFLATRYGFVRYVDGLDESSDLVNPTPVILHASGDLQEKEYGSAQRSFWRTAADPGGSAPPPPEH